MKAFECKNCGATDLKFKVNRYICEYCGSTFLPDTSDGVFNADTSSKSSCVNSGISLSNDILDLLEKCKNDPINAKRYANLILDIDPDNTEALKYV